MPAGGAAPWKAAESHLAGAAGCGASEGRVCARAACRSLPGAGERPAHGSCGLYPFGYRVYPSGYLENFQIPPDLVVKFQAIDIVEVI